MNVQQENRTTEVFDTMPQSSRKTSLSSVSLSVAISFALLACAFLAGRGFDRPVAAKSLPPADAPIVAATSPYIDVHTHLDPMDAPGSIRIALQAMGSENAARLVFMPSPFSPDDPGRFSDEVILSAEKGHRDKLDFLGGGGTLNVMIQQAVRSGEAGSEIQKKFRARAEEILRHGASGFGEMTAEHFATGPGTYYEYAPPDHPLFLLLADISAEHGGVPIDFHMEAVPQEMPLPSGLKSPPNPPRLHANIAAFERLLAHNPRAKIVWAHAGWDNTGYRTPELCRRLLRAHPNLYMEIKVDPGAVGKNSPLANGGSGPIKPAWLRLFQDFPDRFVIGSDQHYPLPPKGPQRWQSAVLLLNQLSPDLQRKIGMENAIRIYRLSDTARTSH